MGGFMYPARICALCFSLLCFSATAAEYTYLNVPDNEEWTEVAPYQSSGGESMVQYVNKSRDTSVLISVEPTAGSTLRYASFISENLKKLKYNTGTLLFGKDHSILLRAEREDNFQVSFIIKSDNTRAFMITSGGDQEKAAAFIATFEPKNTIVPDFTNFPGFFKDIDPASLKVFEKK